MRTENFKAQIAFHFTLFKLLAIAINRPLNQTKLQFKLKSRQHSLHLLTLLFPEITNKDRKEAERSQSNDANHYVTTLFIKQKVPLVVNAKS